ncbi:MULTISPECIES: squalene synthase HpnC [unclassified Variovorax]|uniref:squalene synthase HpnC n=1 Tax=unclassified Variovorax TaxID=663243 RepID=UPI002576E61A|nr:MULTISPECIES: squalene synthase HpnC [unclassified Variovorax]MDM0086003.1 squalene synthase HpnC [Variovorax sp. J22G40]MDM0145740.1 squalene synthase HpnC [Variovorax sp. J2P1-31]
MSSPAPTDVAPPPTHYENFPVASWLCPPRLRPPIAAIYGFARTADDIADEGDDGPEQRLADLRAFGADLAATARGGPISGRWPEVFGPLARAMRDFALPEALLADLLSAFVQDIEKTRDGARYADRAELLAYCSRSANPVGRLLLHLYGVDDAQALAQSDAICSALQLANFWQDLSVDLRRGRFYLPLADCAAHRLAPGDVRRQPPAPEAIALVAAEVAWTRALMAQGAPLVHRLPGRIGWELRLVVQGGLRILDKIEAQGFDSFSHRPTIGAADAPLLAWRALRMRRQSTP